MYPVFVRGEGYLAARQGPEAAAEFQKILDHRGIVLNQPIGALAHLGLARAYVIQGDKAKARSAYRGFLALWEHSDLARRGDVHVLPGPRTERSIRSLHARCAEVIGFENIAPGCNRTGSTPAKLSDRRRGEGNAFEARDRSIRVGHS